MGTFTPEQGCAYLLAFVGWMIGWLVVIFRYGGHEVVTSPAQGVGLAAMFCACAVMSRTAWVLTRASEGPLEPPGTPLFFRFLMLYAMRNWLLLVGAGIPAAIRALRRGR